MVRQTVSSVTMPSICPALRDMSRVFMLPM